MIYKMPKSAKWALLGNTIVDIKIEREKKSPKPNSLADNWTKVAYLVRERNSITDKLHDAFSLMTSHKGICMLYCE